MRVLDEYAAIFYRNPNNRLDDDEGFILHDEDIHMPDNFEKKRSTYTDIYSI